MKKTADNNSYGQNNPMDEPRCKVYGIGSDVIICGSTVRGFVNKECGKQSQTTHIATEVEPKRKASTIKGTLETPKIARWEEEI